MDKESQLLEEYKMLRSEILYFMNKDTTLLTCLFSGVTAVLFFALKEKIYECCVLAYLVILPICSKFAYHQKQMAKISAYMVLHLEKRLEIKWETNLLRLSEIKKNLKNFQEPKLNKKYTLGKYSKFSECPMMAFATMLSYFYLIWKRGVCLKENVSFWLITILMLILFLITLKLWRKIYRIGNYRESYRNLWNMLENMQE